MELGPALAVKIIHSFLKNQLMIFEMGLPCNAVANTPIWTLDCRASALVTVKCHT